MELSNEKLKWLKGLIREDKLVKFYQSREWRELRLVALERDNYECQSCKRRGKYSKAQNVHHIKEVKEYPELALELDNLESICIRCHNLEHKRLEKYVKKNKWANDERW
nr:HNH endonuclease signature motif containing protein [Heyndrickxia oleronia]